MERDRGGGETERREDRKRTGLGAVKRGARGACGRVGHERGVSRVSLGSNGLGTRGYGGVGSDDGRYRSNGVREGTTR